MSNARNLAKVAVDANGDIGTASLDNIDLTTRVAKTGDTMTGTLNVQTGNLNVGSLSNYGGVLSVNRAQTSGIAALATFRDGSAGTTLDIETYGDPAYGTVNRIKYSGPYLAIRNGSQDNLRIDSAGRVTMPYQPAFSYVNTSYTQSTGAYSIIIPGTTRLNRGNHFNGSTGVFTAPVAGFYTFGFWGLSYPHNTENNNIAYFVNGLNSSSGMQFSGNTSNHQIASGGYSVYLNALDTVDLRYYRSSGTAAAYSGQWTMWGYLVG